MRTALIKGPDAYSAAKTLGGRIFMPNNVLDLAPAFPDVARMLFTSDVSHERLAQFDANLKTIAPDCTIGEDDFIVYGKPDDDFR